jgi:phosphoglycolate phosphatase
MLKKVEIFLKNTGKSGKVMGEISRKALAIAEKYELEAAKTTSLLPGVDETLKTLKKMKLKMGLCTINSEKSTDYILKRFKIADYFSAVVSRNRVIHVKPNSEHLEMALKALHVKPDEALVVGDGKSDMKCASDLKVIAVGLPTGLSTNEDLMRAGANYLITSITDLPTLIESINKTSEN